jgi:glucan phosphoethanolaminetransferase (alkaline phosphatase superfamily)
MPWSYVVNTSRFYYHKSQKNQKQIPLPHSKVTNQEKSIFVLVIGESARSQNFSLYGYAKDTNPLLSKIENVTSLLALPLQLRCKGKAIQSNFKMSSYFANKLDKSTIFALQ